MNIRVSELRKIVREVIESLNEDEIIVPKRHIRSLVRPGLKVVRDDDRLRFTVTAVDGEEIVLQDSASGKKFKLTMEKFAQDYSVD